MTPPALCIAALQISNNQLRGRRKCVRHDPIACLQAVDRFRSSNCVRESNGSNEYFFHNRDAAPSNLRLHLTGRRSLARG
jgi:hypothetical protein